MDSIIIHSFWEVLSFKFPKVRSPCVEIVNSEEWSPDKSTFKVEHSSSKLFVVLLLLVTSVCATPRESCIEFRTEHGEKTRDRKSTRLNSSHVRISYAVFCLKKKKKNSPD